MDLNDSTEPEPLIKPEHPCQTPHRSFPRHYWVSLLEDGNLNLLKQRCTTCGKVEDVMSDRWD